MKNSILPPAPQPPDYCLTVADPGAVMHQHQLGQLIKPVHRLCQWLVIQRRFLPIRQR